MKISKSKKKMLLKFVVFSVIMGVIFIFINQYMKIKSKKDEIQRINEQISIEQNKSQEILEKLNEKELDNNQSDSDEDKDKEDSSNQVRVFENIVG